ncbi:beta/gamma crystallin domain-containing protein 2 [Serinus canaria]|uniref:beta/gamma crystallin domain-containing protein 2 n=1 Tax=Serinus canaria TaxID=9135 RepID=UPI0021CC5E54|nr:beta/gamma crystallin domain-containing protein 2 [Serinus canaria]
MPLQPREDSGRSGAPPGPVSRPGAAAEPDPARPQRAPFRVPPFAHTPRPALVEPRAGRRRGDRAVPGVPSEVPIALHSVGGGRERGGAQSHPGRPGSLPALLSRKKRGSRVWNQPDRLPGCQHLRNAKPPLRQGWVLRAGCSGWVLCEHGDFRGRQWLLDCTEITNWLTYSGLQHVGSLYPIRQRRVYFRLRSRELQLFLSVPDDVEDMKAGRVVVSSLSEQSSSVWYYEDGLIKNQVAPTMSLQVIGPAGKGAKAVLWSETRLPRQTWSVDTRGRIHSQMFEDMILDIKGGRSYDRDHAIVWDMSEERPTQVWDIQVL